jgi:DNA-binding NarL/FixJ family response regulator
MDTLTPRELEIVLLIANGLTNPMIAKKLNLSEQTVNAHRRNIFEKLDVHSIAALVKKVMSDDKTKDAKPKSTKKRK